MCFFITSLDISSKICKTEMNSFSLFCLFFIFHSEKVKTFSNSAAMDYNRTDELRARGELREFA